MQHLTSSELRVDRGQQQYRAYLQLLARYLRRIWLYCCSQPPLPQGCSERACWKPSVRGPVGKTAQDTVNKLCSNSVGRKLRNGGGALRTNLRRANMHLSNDSCRQQIQKQNYHVAKGSQWCSKGYGRTFSWPLGENRSN